MTFARPTPDVLRAMTDETVIRAMLQHSPATRAQLAVRTGLSKPAVADAIRRLEDKGLVCYTGQRTTGRGGVGSLYALGPAVGRALVVSVAPGGIDLEVLDAAGEAIACQHRPLARPTDSADARRQLSAAARGAVRKAGKDLEARRVSVAVISAADPVDRASGRLVRLPDSPFLVGALDPAPVLKTLVDGPVIVDNDVNWAARHEHQLFATRGTPIDDFAYLFLGEGLGCAIVSDGQVRRGHSGLAGEIAHTLTAGPNGMAMPFTAVFDALGLHESGSAAIDLTKITHALADPDAMLVVARAVAGVIAAVVTLTDPATVVLGGPWGGQAEIMSAVTSLVSQAARPVRIEPSRSPTDASLAGARSEALTRLADITAEHSRRSRTFT
jgi:predicted NBD/HSP70 family sugar kinase